MLVIYHTSGILITSDISVGVTVLPDIQTAQLVLKVMASGLALHHQALPNPLAQGNLKQIDCYV
jgi:hypothetical protein